MYGVGFSELQQKITFQFNLFTHVSKREIKIDFGRFFSNKLFPLSIVAKKGRSEMLRRVNALWIAVAAVFIINSFAKAGDHVKHVKVALTQIMAHPAADTVRKGVEDVLAENGYKQGENLELTFYQRRAIFLQQRKLRVNLLVINLM